MGWGGGGHASPGRESVSDAEAEGGARRRGAVLRSPASARREPSSGLRAGTLVEAAEVVHGKFLELDPWRRESRELVASGGGTAPLVGTSWLGAAGAERGQLRQAACTGVDVSGYGRGWREKNCAETQVSVLEGKWGRGLF